ncbi:MAG TPA: alpha-glucosidase [Acidobacteriaceae bacterium]
MAAALALAASLTPLPSLAQAAHAGSDPWWKHAVLYEIYPRSFQDSNGDGIGDLNGITQRLDYLKKLGVDAIWISPMYPSPQVDFGYDISDYENVDPQYGTLADFDRLVAEAGKRKIRILLDMVMNHTSDQHAWFKESASSRNNAKADWFVWQDAKGYTAEGKPIPPNNWTSLFGGSAWQWVPARKQFYYHDFYKQQPDLNWRNPAVEAAMFATIRFWLDRGVAGFRFDAVPSLFEDPQLRDEPVTEPGLNAQGDPKLSDIYTNNLPEVHDVMRRLRAMTDKYPGDRVLIGETYLPNVQELNKWYGGERHDELQLPMDMQVGFTNKLDAALLRKHINDAETGIGTNQPLFVFDNHDNQRSWDRYGDGAHNAEIARLVAALLLTSRATALMYYGQEIGMVTTTPTRKEDVKDPIGITGWPNEKGRDGERTPMQWDEGKNAGFSTAAVTWLPIPPNYPMVNVAVEAKAPDSLLHWYEQLIAMRRSDPALREGRMTMLNPDDPSVIAYVRAGAGGGSARVVAVNCTGEPRTITLDPSQAGAAGGRVRTLLTDAPSLQKADALTLTLPPFASWVAALE